MKKIALFLIVTLAAVTVCMNRLSAQPNIKAIQDAFESSYAFESKGNYPDALAAMKAVYDESSYEINIRIGWLNYFSGSFIESTAYYQKAIALKPYSIEAKFGYVLPQAALGNWELVIGAYEEILRIDPQNTQANYRLGAIYYGRKDFAKADKYLEKVVNLYPFDYDSMILFAWTSLKLGKYREAQVLFNKTLMIRPQDSSALEGLALIK